MPQVYNVQNDVWERPWNKVKFNDLYNRDERFFALLVKGALGWLTSNIVLYDKPVRHFIFNTGSTYLYIEKNGYEYDLKSTSGEDMMYMERPRCNVEIDTIGIQTEELSQPNIRGEYERRSSLNGIIKGFNAEFRRIPLQMTFNLHYYTSNFNECIILIEELISKMLFQKYFNITYLGQVIKCSIEFPRDFKININKADLANPDDNNNSIDIQIVVCSNYPAINERTEIPSDKVIASFESNVEMYKEDKMTDKDIKKID